MRPSRLIHGEVILPSHSQHPAVKISSHGKSRAIATLFLVVHRFIHKLCTGERHSRNAFPYTPFGYCACARWRDRLAWVVHGYVGMRLAKTDWYTVDGVVIVDSATRCETRPSDHDHDDSCPRLEQLRLETPVHPRARWYVRCADEAFACQARDGRRFVWRWANE